MIILKIILSLAAIMILMVIVGLYEVTRGDRNGR